jgi:RHS repeat-associated protein
MITPPEFGRLTGTSFPNGFSRSLEYDERSRLVAMHYRRGSAQPLYSALYDHDQVGNRVTQLKTRASGTETLAHRYSERDELLRTVKNQATTVNYRYDDNYNRLLAGPATESVNIADQLTSRNTPAGGEFFAYDSGGKMTRRSGPGGASEYDYNWSDQITQVRPPGGGISVNAFDGNGQRVQKREPDGRLRDYLWSGDEIVKEYDESGTPQASYLLGLGREATRVDGAWHFYVTDAQGSTVFLVDAAGNVSASYDYDDWGNLTSSTGSVYNPFLYTGQQFDADTGLYYLRARFYAPDIGRFTSRDPIGYAGGSNLYAYCGGNPVNFADPSGLERVYFGRHGDPEIPPPWQIEQAGPVRQAGLTVVIDNQMTWQRARSALTSGDYAVVTTAVHSDSGTSLHFTQPEARLTWPTLNGKITAKAFIANGCVTATNTDFQALATTGSGRIVAGWTEMLGYNEYSGFNSRFIVLLGEGKSANEALKVMADEKNSAGDPLFPRIGSFKVFGDVDKPNLLSEDP